METLKHAFLRKFPENKIIFDYFLEANDCECTWGNLTKLRLQRFVDYLQTRIAPNSVKTYCSKLKGILTQFNEEIQLPKDYQKVLQIRVDASQHVYLNTEEIKRIIAYEPQTHAEHVIKNWFLIGCLTGARHSDYIRFTESNIHDNELHYVSIKTHTQTILPLSDYVRTLIRENARNGYNNVHYSDVYFNRLLHRICQNAGINEVVTLYTRGKFLTDEKWRFVASHTARRSFATNLYRNGVDIYTISKLCGHSGVEMTKQYICCGANVNDNVLGYFRQFDDKE